MNSGIYQIMNKRNYHMYIGSAVDFNKRWNEHKLSLRKNKHHCKYLQNAWNKDGEDSFEFSEIEFVDRRELIDKEQYYFDLLKPEYNSCRTAGSTMGAEFYKSEEYKTKKNNAIRGFKHTSENKKKFSAMHIGNKYNLGKKRTADEKVQMSKLMEERWKKPGYREKLSAAHKGLFLGDKHPLYGKPVSEETREKIRKAHLGKKRGPNKK